MLLAERAVTLQHTHFFRFFKSTVWLSQMTYIILGDLSLPLLGRFMKIARQIEAPVTKRLAIYFWYLSFLVAISLSLCSCAKAPYHPQGDMFPNPEPFQDEPQISRGEPNVVVDGLGNYLFSLPEKLILWNWKMGSHDISPETEAVMQTYLERNQLKEVKVRLNEYAPIGEWRRLVNNDGVGAGWRYSLGLLSWLFYTILPGRLLGGDAYNPYTNSIYLYSDVPAVALHEGGHAKDIAGRNWKGSRAALYILPTAPLFIEARATNDALGYSLDTDPKLLDSGYKVLYPAYGTYVGSEALGAVPIVGTLIGAVGAIPGHILGRIKASNVRERYPEDFPPDDDGEHETPVAEETEPTTSTEE